MAARWTAMGFCCSAAARGLKARIAHHLICGRSKLLPHVSNKENPRFAFLRALYFTPFHAFLVRQSQFSTCPVDAEVVHA
jgi:hypothetical protein